MYILNVYTSVNLEKKSSKLIKTNSLQIPIFQSLKNPLRTAGHKYSLRRYKSDFWNVLDTVSYITTFVAIALRFSDTTLPWARRVYSFSLFFMYMRFLHVILIFRKIGVYVILIKEMVSCISDVYY